MNNEELKALVARQDAQLARGEALLEKTRELVKEMARLMGKVAYEPLGEEWQLDETDTEIISLN